MLLDILERYFANNGRNVWWLNLPAPVNWIIGHLYLSGVFFVEWFHLNDILYIWHILFLHFYRSLFLLYLKLLASSVACLIRHIITFHCESYIILARYRIEYLRSRCGNFYEHALLVNVDLSINWLTHRDRAESRSPLTITMTPVRQTGDRVACHALFRGNLKPDTLMRSINLYI